MLKKLRMFRSSKETCKIPTKILKKFESSKLGCMRLEFSNRGKYLAAACTMEDSRTIIKIFEVIEEEKLVFRYRGHSNIIH